MRITFPLLLLGTTVLFSGCADNSAEPDPDPSDNPTSIASETIGSGGGILAAEGFAMTVPAGVFDSDVNISLYISGDTDPFEGNGVSDEYRIEGLPDDCSGSLKIRIAHDGNLSDSSFIAVGGDAIVAATGDTSTSYDFLPAVDSSGYLVCDLPAWSTAKEGKSALSGEPMTYRIIGISRYVTYTTGGTAGNPAQYDLRIPSGIHVTTADMMDLVDGAHHKILGLGYAPITLVGTMLRVVVRDLGEEYCRFVYRNRDQVSTIVLNHKKINSTDLPQMRIAVGREVYRWILFSYNYDPYYPVMVGGSQQDYLWLNEAAIAWIGEKFAPADQQAAYIPEGFKGNEEAPFQGMQMGANYGSGDAATCQRRHGQGMAAMIKHLADWLDPHNPACITSCIHSQLGSRPGPSKHPVEALASAISGENGNLRSWFPVFISKYCLGWIYGVKWEDFVEEVNVSAIMVVDDEHDTLAVYRHTYPDLSAKRYLIDLNYALIPENATAEIKLNTSVAAEDLKINVYKLLGGTMSLLATGNRRVEISNIRGLTDEFADIFFLVTNSSYHSPHYTQASNIDVEVRVKGTRELDFTYCKVHLQAIGQYRTSDGYHWTGSADLTGSAIGSFTENQFSGAWDPGVHGSSALGGINVRMNSQATRIEELVFAYDLTSFGITYETTIRAEDLPFIQVTYWGNTQYGMEGGDLISNVSQAENWMISGDYHSGFDVIDADQDSYIFVEFR